MNSHEKALPGPETIPDSLPPRRPVRQSSTRRMFKRAIGNGEMEERNKGNFETPKEKKWQKKFEKLARNQTPASDYHEPETR